MLKSTRDTPCHIHINKNKYVCTGNEDIQQIWNKFIIRKNSIETSQVVLNFCRTFSLFFSILASLTTPTRKFNLVRDFFMFEIPARELYYPVAISGLIRKLIYGKQTTKVKEKFD